MIGAYGASDYYYVNHSNKYVCFHYKFSKRVKGKLTDFLKENNEEAKLLKYLKENGLMIKEKSTSRRYIHYTITDLMED